MDEERVARIGTKEKLATTELQLRQTRARVSKMDKQLREAEASIASLTGTVKMLEDQVNELHYRYSVTYKKVQLIRISIICRVVREKYNLKLVQES